MDRKCIFYFSTMILAILFLTVHSKKAEAFQNYTVPGDIVSLQVNTDRGPARVYYHDGKYYIEGRKGERYSLRIKNNTGSRVKVVVSVDGLSVLDGRPASFSGAGYVIAPYASIEIEGWRYSMNRVASFTFSSLENAYATSRGLPQNTGVIGVAAFREFQPVLISTPDEARIFEKLSGPGHGYLKQRAASPLPSTFSSKPPATLPGNSRQPVSPVRSREQSGSAQDRKIDTGVNFEGCEPPFLTQNIGTGWGEDRISVAEYTTFNAASSSPDTVLTLYYDDYDGLVRRGVLPRKYVWPGLKRPRPFPEEQKFCPCPEKQER